MTARARVASLLAWVLTAQAQASHAAGLRPVLVAGYDTGGDKVANVTFTNGKTDWIRANEGLYLGGGVSVLNEARSLEFLATLSIKYQGLYADNGDLYWTRFPLDALLFYRRPSFRLGGGLTYAMKPRLKGSGDASGINATPDNALGAVLQADYLVDRVALGLRVTLLDYELGGSTLRSSGVGVSFGFTF
jgi:hypothetical protein